MHGKHAHIYVEYCHSVIRSIHVILMFLILMLHLSKSVVEDMLQIK
jgi:hypothetical protein